MVRPHLYGVWQCRVGGARGGVAVYYSCRQSCCLFAVFQVTTDLPHHINEQIMDEQQQEKLEKERQEWEKSLCKVRGT